MPTYNHEEINMNKSITFDEKYNGLSINTNKEKGQGVYTDIVDRHHAHLSDMTDKHSKVLQTRFDLHYPADGSVTPNRTQLQDFTYNLTRKLSREKVTGGHKVDPRLITVTEQASNNSHPHIHGVILVNGNAKQNSMGILKQIEKTWGIAIQSSQSGLVHYCDHQGDNGLMVNRNSTDFEQQINACSHQASYLAKTRDKDNNPKGSWKVTGTRLPKK